MYFYINYVNIISIQNLFNRSNLFIILSFPWIFLFLSNHSYFYILWIIFAINSSLRNVLLDREANELGTRVSNIGWSFLGKLNLLELPFVLFSVKFCKILQYYAALNFNRIIKMAGWYVIFVLIFITNKGRDILSSIRKKLNIWNFRNSYSCRSTAKHS